MSETTPTNLPNPTKEMAALWLSQLDTPYVHNKGWVQVNQRYHGLALAARRYINERYADPAERQAAFDGMTLGLLAMTHFADIAQLDQLFLETGPAELSTEIETEAAHQDAASVRDDS